MTVSETIREYMSRNRITYREAAERTGCSFQSIWSALNGRAGSRKENGNGTRASTLGSVRKICRGIGLELTVVRTVRTGDPSAVLEEPELQDCPVEQVRAVLNAAGLDITVREKDG